MKWQRWITGLAGGGLMLASAVAWQGVPMPVEELTRRADLVVHGRVANRTCRKDDAGRLYTEVTLRVDDVWKGRLGRSELTVVHSGGTVPGETVVVTGQVCYAMNEEVVAFLIWNAQGQGVTVGLAQGKFEVFSDANQGEKRVRSAWLGDGAVSAPSRSEAGRPANARITLAQMKQRVRQAAQ